MKHLSTNNRAASEVIGAILIFALVVTALALVQVTAVPVWNQQTEFDHNERVVSGMTEFSDDIDRVATTGTGGSRSFELGVDYQSRPFLFNPSSPAGSIQTGDQQQIILDNVAADGPTGDYWTGEARQFTTTSIAYKPVYTEYQNAPTTVYAPPTLYNRFEGGDVVLASGQLIDDRQITLVTLDGELAHSTTGFLSVEMVPLSAPAQNIPVHAKIPEQDGDWEPIRLTIPTQLSVAEWEVRLSDQLYDAADPSSGNVLNISSAGADAVLLELRPNDGDGEPIPYSISMAHLGIEKGYDRSAGAAHYVTTDQETVVTVRPVEQHELTVQVRDRYNNPVTGERVTFSTQEGFLSTDTASDADELTVRTDRFGEATVQHQRNFVGSGTVDAVIGDEATDREQVVFTIATTDPDSQAPGEGTINQPAPLRLQEATAESECKPNQNKGCTVTVAFSQTGSGSITVEQARFAFYGSAGPGTDASQLPQTLEFPVNSTALEIRDAYKNVSTATIASGDDWEIDVLFRDGNNDRYPVQTSEFFVISIITDSGEFTYFVNPIGG